MTVQTAACLAVGSELLGGRRLDSNSLKITQALARTGVRVTEKRIVGDQEEQIAAAIRSLLETVDLLVVTGGLGPTQDDVTRQGVARALARDLEFDAGLMAGIKHRYEELGLPMPQMCSRMAQRLPGARMLHNSRGTAPGMLIETGGRLLAVLPGVPGEMEAMLETYLVPELERRNPGRIRSSRTLLLSGVVESRVEARIQPLYERFGRENITILAAPGVVRLIMMAAGSNEDAARRLDEMERAFRAVLGGDVAGTGGGTLAGLILERFRGKNQTLATAESCTGGLVGKLITDVPGSSDVYAGGVISYSNAVKEALVDVPATVLESYGAVSAETARAMAEGVRRRLGTDWGLGITGIAGPGGGTNDKPVGLVHWAVAGPQGTRNAHRVFPGGRSMIRTWSANLSLDLLRRMLDAEAAT